MRYILGVLLLVSMPAHANPDWHPTKDAVDMPLTVVVHIVPKDALLTRCKRVGEPVGACAFIGPQGCAIIMPEPDTYPPDVRWRATLGHETLHCLFGRYHD